MVGIPHGVQTLQIMGCRIQISPRAPPCHPNRGFLKNPALNQSNFAPGGRHLHCPVGRSVGFLRLGLYAEWSPIKQRSISDASRPTTTHTTTPHSTVHGPTPERTRRLTSDRPGLFEGCLGTLRTGRVSIVPVWQGHATCYNLILENSGNFENPQWGQCLGTCSV